MSVRAKTPLITVALLLSLLVVDARPALARPRRVEGSFTATASPLPQPWFAPGFYSCDNAVEGVHKVTHGVAAPFSGWFHVDMMFQPTGPEPAMYDLPEWDLALVSDEGELLAWSQSQWWYGTPTETIDYYLRRGQSINIVACNGSSRHPAHVSYSLEAKSPWPAGSAVNGKSVRDEELSYVSPSVGTSDLGIMCQVGYNVGCVGTEPAAADRYVSIDLRDRASSTVAFEFFQFVGSTEMTSLKFCGTSAPRIPLHPRADWVGVSVYTGPCSDGTPAHATQGDVTLRFSNR